MYGKIFESLYRGSMVGAGSPTFAVWGYVIANMRADEKVGAQVDLNPKLLAFILGDKEEVIEDVISKLCGPDPRSTSKQEEGKRLIRIGEFAFRVVNGASYMKIRNEEDRREYFRLKKQEQRRRSKPLPGETAYVKGIESGVLDPATGAPTTQPELEAEGYHPESRTALHWLNQQSGKNFREVDSNLSVISVRLRENGVDIAGVKLMIERQCKRWKGTPQEEYLRPETLFRKSKFDSYYAARTLPIQNEASGGNSSKGFDRNKGTFNEGKSHLYQPKPYNPS